MYRWNHRSAYAAHRQGPATDGARRAPSSARAVGDEEYSARGSPRLALSATEAYHQRMCRRGAPLVAPPTPQVDVHAAPTAEFEDGFASEAEDERQDLHNLSPCAFTSVVDTADFPQCLSPPRRHGSSVGAAPGTAIAAIESNAVPVEPSASTLQHRRDAGMLPFPSRMTYRLDPSQFADVRRSAHNASSSAKNRARDCTQSSSEAEATTQLSHCRTHQQSASEWMDENRRRMNAGALRSHHVPLVGFYTQANMKRLRAGPTIAEAAALGAEAAARRALEQQTMLDKEALTRALAILNQPLSGQHQPEEIRKVFASVRSTYPATFTHCGGSPSRTGNRVWAKGPPNTTTLGPPMRSNRYGWRAGAGPHRRVRSTFLNPLDMQEFWTVRVDNHAKLLMDRLDRSELLLAGDLEDSLSRKWVMTGRHPTPGVE